MLLSCKCVCLFSRSIFSYQALNAQFTLKDLGCLHYFLGIAVHKLVDGSLFLNQKKYVCDLLAKVYMMHTKPSYTLMDFYATLLAYYSIDMEDNSPYKSVVDSLQYITITRPDLAFYVKKVCQFMSHPNDVHWVMLREF